MTEVLEYSLVFLLSLVLASSSIGIASSYVSYSRTLQDRVAFASVSDGAWRAIDSGWSVDAITFASAEVSCRGGVLSLSSPYYASLTALPVGCEFSFSQLDGQRDLSFSFSSGTLALEVT